MGWTKRKKIIMNAKPKNVVLISLWKILFLEQIQIMAVCGIFEVEVLKIQKLQICVILLM